MKSKYFVIAWVIWFHITGINSNVPKGMRPLFLFPHYAVSVPEFIHHSHIHIMKCSL